MYYYSYDIVKAELEHGVRVIAPIKMKQLGFKIIKSEPDAVDDVWWFETKNKICEYPPYINQLNTEIKFTV